MTNSIQTLGAQVNVFIDELKAAILSSMAAAAEGIRLEAEVARVMTRMEAFHAVLAGIDAQKHVVEKALDTARSPAQQQSLRLQLQLLDQQTVAVLVRSGLSEETARQSIAVVATPEKANGSQQPVRRVRVIP